MVRRLEHFFSEIISGHRPAGVLKPFLFCLSYLYRWILKYRHFAYDRGWFSTYSSGTLTISVGNITVGGTGKTPFVAFLTKNLEAYAKVAILTRGFRSETEKTKKSLHLIKGKGISPGVCGDEPLWLAENTNASIWVGRDRYQSACRARDEGATCLILEDGFQHRRLKRNDEVVLVDAQDPFSSEKLLPYGRLRDLPERLACADLIIATRTKNFNQYRKIKKALVRYTRAPVVAMQTLIVAKPEWRGERWGVFCGIAQPQYFLEDIRSCGVKIVGVEILLDHEPVELPLLKQFMKRCASQGATKIVCTEKDAVKWPRGIEQLPLPVEAIPMHLKIIAGQEHWDQWIRSVKERL